MNDFFCNNDATIASCVTVVVGAILRKIDLVRIKRGKKPIFESILEYLKK
jgi:hypothetical protein